MHTSMGVRTVITEDFAASPHSLHLESTATAIILEGRLVINYLQNCACYPPQLRNTFGFVQRVLL